MADKSSAAPTVLITGATEGIGYELSKIYAKEAYELVLVARNEERLKSRKRELEDEFGVPVAIIRMDLSEPGAAKKLFELTEKHEIVVDELINNAGYGLIGRFDKISLDDQLNMIQLNVAEMTALCRLYLEQMVARGSGKIMNVASTASFQPGPMMAAYYATKAFVLHLTEAIAVETKGTGVTVCALCPGPTASKFQERAGFKKPLLTQMGMMSSASVAKTGFAKMQRGKTVIITGLMNRLFAQSYRFFPRKMIQSVIRMLQKNRE